MIVLFLNKWCQTFSWNAKCFRKREPCFSCISKRGTSLQSLLVESVLGYLRWWWWKYQHSQLAENQNLGTLFLSYLGKIRNFVFSLPNDLLLPDVKTTCNLDSKKVFLEGSCFQPLSEGTVNYHWRGFPKTSALELFGEGWRVPLWAI